jgi:hypothetical protein
MIGKLLLPIDADINFRIRVKFRRRQFDGQAKMAANNQTIEGSVGFRVAKPKRLDELPKLDLTLDQDEIYELDQTQTPWT